MVFFLIPWPPVAGSAHKREFNTFPFHGRRLYPDANISDSALMQVSSKTPTEVHDQE